MYCTHTCVRARSCVLGAQREELDGSITAWGARLLPLTPPAAGWEWGRDHAPLKAFHDASVARHLISLLC